jgi:hypothetical protein
MHVYIYVHKGLYNYNIHIYTGNSATAPDFHLWEQLDQLRLISALHSIENPVDSFILLSSYLRDFTALPGMQKYLSSKLSTLPMNNQMASIGACPNTHGPWKKDQKMEWSGLSGLY